VRELVGSRINWGQFEPIFLPPYSPDLNPIERLWRVLKAEWFCDFIAKDRAALMARLDVALQWAIARVEGNQVTCTIKKERKCVLVENPAFCP
jgi:transposase